MKGNACFYCKHSINGHVDPNPPGWSYDCGLGLDNSNLNGGYEKVLECEKAEPRWGFQMGGYYTHMWFELDGTPIDKGGERDPCLIWHIQGDGEFPSENQEEDNLRFHICDFEQIEKFVKLWGNELRRRGWITEEEDICESQEG